MREAIDIFQPSLVLGKYLDGSTSARGIQRLNRGVFRRGEGSVNDSDGLEFAHILLTRRLGQHMDNGWSPSPINLGADIAKQA